MKGIRSVQDWSAIRPLTVRQVIPERRVAPRRLRVVFEAPLLRSISIVTRDSENGLRIEFSEIGAK